MTDAMLLGGNNRARLPEPRSVGRYAVAFVCTGNICRSPSAEVVLRSKVSEAGLADRVRIASCGLRSWHIGEPMDERSARHLRESGYDPDRVRGEQVGVAWLEEYDVLLAMDRGHLEGLRQLGAGSQSRGSRASAEGRLMLFRTFDLVGTGEDTPDPYYGGDSGFGEVLQMVERTCQQLVTQIQSMLSGEGAADDAAERSR